MALSALGTTDPPIDLLKRRDCLFIIRFVAAAHSAFRGIVLMFSPHTTATSPHRKKMKASSNCAAENCQHLVQENKPNRVCCLYSSLKNVRLCCAFPSEKEWKRGQRIKFSVCSVERSFFARLEIFPKRRSRK